MNRPTVLWAIAVSCGLAACMGETRPSPTPMAAPDLRGQAPSLLPLVSVPLLEGDFAERVSYGDRELILNGSGLCEWGIFGIDLYRAAMYVERRPQSVEQALAGDQVVVFHLAFVRQLTGNQLAQAYTAAVRANGGNGHDAALAQLIGFLRTIQAGESYSFVLDPALGVLVQRGGANVGRIEDDAFRKLFLRLYLGDHPPTVALREGLLGKAQRRENSQRRENR